MVVGDHGAFALTWCICLVREFRTPDGVENGLLLGGDVGGECLVGAVKTRLRGENQPLNPVAIHFHVIPRRKLRAHLDMIPRAHPPSRQ